MIVDLYKFNQSNIIDIDSDVTFNEEMYSGMNINAIKDAHVSGQLMINSFDELELNLVVTGTFILPNTVTLEETSREFEAEIEENYGNIDKFWTKTQNSLDILPLLWENIVSEVPMRVVDGNEPEELNGNGWQYISNAE